MTFPILGGNSAVSAGAYSIDNSLRFNDNDSPKLKRTTTGSGTQSTYTFSAWCKRSSFGSYQYLFSHRASGGANAYGLAFDRDSEKLYVYNGSLDLTTAVYRDASAWYHIVLSVSSGSYTLYVNGSSVKTGSAQSIVLGESMTIGAYEYSTTVSFLDGYMAEVHFIDGTAKAQTDFGEFDSDSGIWKPISYSGSYGTNGFHLDFEDSSSLGNDVSGNNNDFTATNLASTDQTTDTPTNNFATLNFLTSGAEAEFSQGNLRFAANTVQTYPFASSTIGFSSGKWYCEFLREANAVTGGVGIFGTDLTGNGDPTTRYTYERTGSKYNNASYTSYGASWGVGDVIGIAYDGSTGNVVYYKNGVSQGTAYTIPTSAVYVFGCQSYTSGTQVDVANFGQEGSFAGNKTAGGNTDANGFGNFLYSVPSGHLALCTQNLATELSPTIDDGSKHFNTVIWSGDGTDDRSITGVGFQPDTVWYKERNNAVSHRWVDAVRGIGKELYVDISNAEYAASNELQAYESDGFQIGSDGSINGSGDTYVGWCWKAGGTTPTQTYTVKVVSDSGNKYRFDDFGTSAVTLDLQEGGTYTFDQSDSSNSGHPLRFSTTSDGTHGSGSEYTIGVTTTGTAGSAGAKTVITVAASAPTLYYYCTQHSGMGGQANTNSTFGSSNFAGSIQSTVSANTTAGFSIITYTGNATDNSTIGHGLGKTPSMIILKKRSAADDWAMYHSGLTSGKEINLNYTNAEKTDVNNATWGDNYPSSIGSSTFAVGYAGDSNENSQTYVGYCFAEIEGYSKFGSYTGNGSDDGTFVYTGFKPAWVMIKNITQTSAGAAWHILDIKRDSFNEMSNELAANAVASENGVDGGVKLDFLSNGFKLSGNTYHNYNGGTHIYMAFASNPFVSSSGVPNTAR